jgi:protein O-mannosyl-transferase
MTTQIFQDLSLKKTMGYLLLLTALVTLIYSNHFNNQFHFDDTHTVTNNLFIRDIKNIPLFFKDGTTFSSLAQNQSYRPVVSTSLAFDYWLGKGCDPFYFHLSSFIIFLLQGTLMFFFTFKILDLSFKNSWNFYIAALATAWYMFHPANAETINYIIARSDLQATFFVLLAFVLFIFSPFCRKYFIYLVAVGLGTLAKPPAVMFAPMLFFYVLMFEQKASLSELLNKKVLAPTILKTMPALFFCAIMYMLVDHLTPRTWQSGGSSVYHYFITQPFVIVHYFTTLFLPFGLSADTDWTPLDSIADYRFFVGGAFILLLIVIAIRTSKNEKYRPVSFGIMWFFLALIPTSSVIPLSEVMNDHRIFFPYVGLIISVCWSIGLLLLHYKNKFQIVSPRYGMAIMITAVLLLSGYSYGTHQRNIVWHSEESLWYDVTVKSPKNGRGLMNYGLVRMEKGDYSTAEKYFTRAIALWTKYNTLYINMAILKNATGDKIAAEDYFKRGIEYGVGYANGYFYYGRFLTDQMRYPEAIKMLNKALEISPADLNTRTTLMKAYQGSEDWNMLNKLVLSTLELDAHNAEALTFLEATKLRKGSVELFADEVKKSPTAEKYLDLSLKYYQKGRYEECIGAAREALKLKPDYAEAYNNIGSAYNNLKQYDKAIAACQKAIEINPGFQIARNNLAWALNQRNELSKR